MLQSQKLLAATALNATAMLLLSGYSSCDPIIQNNGFDLWCGDTLCSWEVEDGDIERVPTWHERDYGVSLLGDGVAISQLSDITGEDVTCLRFSLLADIDVTATVMLQMDLYDDGVIDYERPIPASDWAPIAYVVTLPDDYQGIRFRITKTGTGRAVLAQIVAEDFKTCTEPPLAVTDLPAGAECSVADDCASDICTPAPASLFAANVCGECATDTDCAAGDVCGIEPPLERIFLDHYRACVPAASRGLGERCAVDGECATGICCEGLCSTCCDGADCPAGQACELRDRQDEYVFWAAPHQCAPAGGLGATGTDCLIDADCASSSCQGAGDLDVCLLDGRRCSGDEDCPSDFECVTIGTDGGTCQ
jgi:Cys-rich repeat protein